MSAHTAGRIVRRAKKPDPDRGRRARTANYPWTAQSIALAVKLTQEGVAAPKVAQQIHETWPELGKPTRCAVIGKVNCTAGATNNRFVVINGGPRPVEQRVQKINKSTASETGRSPPTAVNLEALPVSDIQSLAEPSMEAARKLGPTVDPFTKKVFDATSIRRGLCHYPIGDPYKPGFGYCGRSAYVNKEHVRVGEHGITPYCADHRLLVYDPVEARRRDNELKKLNRHLPKNLRS